MWTTWWIATTLLNPAALAAGTEGEPTEPPALTLAADSVASRPLVAVGRDLVIRGEARSDVAVLDGTLHVSGTVAGDAIALGGDIRLEGSARVEGDLVALGGEIHTSPSAILGGRALAYPTAPSSLVVLLEGPSLGLDPTSSVVLGLKLALLAAWLTAALVLSATGPGAVSGTAASVRREPFRNFFLGLTAVVTLLLTILLLSTVLAPLLGVPLVVLAVLAAMVCKIWGMVAVFFAFGQVVMELVGRRNRAPVQALVAGVVVLGALKLVPWIGIWVWTLATFVGVGATLGTKFGRYEDWFDEALTAS